VDKVSSRYDRVVVANGGYVAVPNIQREPALSLGTKHPREEGNVANSIRGTYIASLVS
jgi:hypothetical protein